MKILYVSQHNAFGTKSGGDIASHSFLRCFSEISHGNIDLVTVEELRNKRHDDIILNNIIYVKPRNVLQLLLSVFNGHLNRYIPTVESILTSKEKYDWVVFDHNAISGPLVKIANCRNIKTITIHHNYEKEYFADNNSFLYRFFFLHHVVKWEKRAYKNSNLNLFLTNQDKSTFKEVYGSCMGYNDVIGVFEYKEDDIPLVSQNSNSKLTFAITGSLCDYQTEDAIIFFFEELYKYLPKDCKIIIAGRNPTPMVVSLCSRHQNVTLVPNPENMNTILEKADIYLCATRIGGGLKLRVLDGLRNGLPVITHECSARGFDAFWGSDVFYTYSTGEEFKKELSKVIENFYRTGFDKNIIQKEYLNRFSYKTGLKRLTSILNNAHLL